jgi:adenosine deaminase
MLDLDAVQHGISAVGSKDVMKWLAQKGTMLNICPTSNVRLRNAESLKAHPIRILFDNGVKCSVNSDDITVFNSTVTDEFFALYNAGTMSAEELDELRINGLKYLGL